MKIASAEDVRALSVRGWGTVLLDSVTRRGSGHTPDKKRPEYWNGTIKWVSLKDSDKLDHGYIFDTADKVTSAGIANSSAVEHPRETVVLSRDAGVGKSAVLADVMAVSQHFMAWQCGPQLHNWFLYYWLQHRKPEFERVAIGNTIKTIGLPYFRLLEIPLPPLAEQRAIVAALSDVDALIGSLDQLIAKKRDLKQAAMQQLLTGQTRLPGFTTRWRATTVGELGRWRGGLTPSMSNPRYWAGGDVPWASSGDIKSTTVSRTGSSITREGLAATSLTLFNPGAVMVVMRSGILRRYLPVARNLVPMAVNQDIKALALRADDALPEYVVHLLQYQGPAILASCLKAGTTVESIEFPWLKAFQISIPERAEQVAIAAVLSDMDAEITALEARRDKTKLLKIGMMQELLTGRTRLV